tara:strand:- start:5256 stop:5828 length:573 start_codon:yes stop_codon:yes gene_type:complete
MIERNQLAELIIDDGQPARAMITYLSEAMELLQDFECVNDYSSADLKVSKFKMDDNVFLSSLSCALVQLINKRFDLTDLYLRFNYYFDDNDDEFDQSEDEPCIGFYLVTSNDKRACSNFIIIPNVGEPFLASINVDYYNELDSNKYNGKRFVFANDINQQIYFSVCGTNGNEIIDYNPKDINEIVPLDLI